MSDGVLAYLASEGILHVLMSVGAMIYARAIESMSYRVVSTCRLVCLIVHPTPLLDFLIDISLLLSPLIDAKFSPPTIATCFQNVAV